MDKLRLSRAAVRLVRPGVRIVGLDEFEEVFLIIGTLTDMTTTEKDTIIGPKKVPGIYREVEVSQGRHAVLSQVGCCMFNYSTDSQSKYLKQKKEISKIQSTIKVKLFLSSPAEQV